MSTKPFGDELDFDAALARDVHINQGDLYGDFLIHPGRFAYWATLYEMSLHEVNTLKNELKRMYAKIDFNTRQEMKNAGMKSTEMMVENTVITHPKYVELQSECGEAELRSGLLKAARDAMIHRRDMLIQLGATARAEGAADISIREDTVRDIINR